MIDIKRRAHSHQHVNKKIAPDAGNKKINKS